MFEGKACCYNLAAYSSTAAEIAPIVSDNLPRRRLRGGRQRAETEEIIYRSSRASIPCVVNRVITSRCCGRCEAVELREITL